MKTFLSRVFLLLFTLVPGLSLSNGDRIAALHTPGFRLDIYSTGRIEFYDDYRGRTTVPKTNTITREQIAHLVSEFEKAEFFSLADVYSEGRGQLKDGREVRTFSSDLPASSIYFSSKKREKKVMYSVGAPEALRVLERRIIEISGVGHWVKQSLGK